MLVSSQSSHSPPSGTFLQDLDYSVSILLKQLQLQKDKDNEKVQCLLVQYTLCRIHPRLTQVSKYLVERWYDQYKNRPDLLGIFEPCGLIHYFLKNCDFTGWFSQLRSRRFVIDDFDLQFMTKHLSHRHGRFLLKGGSWKSRYEAELELTWSAHHVLALDEFLCLETFVPENAIVSLIFQYWQTFWVAFYPGVLYDDRNNAFFGAIDLWRKRNFCEKYLRS
jgi:hypothetical protein